MRVQSFILGVVLTVLWAVTPFRLATLGAETFWLHSQLPRFSQADDRFWDAVRLESKLLARGWTVTYATHVSLYGQPAWGLTSLTAHRIFVDEGLHWNARLAVLAHEAGHTMQPDWLAEGEAECFAESVSTLVSRDGVREHARYMASARWTCLGLLLAEFPAIYRAAATFQE